MRALGLAIVLVACGPPPPAAEPGEPGRAEPPRALDGPFAAPRDFEPVAFGVKVTGAGRPIIFIPGLGCPGEVWDETVAHLGDAYQAHVLTLSGFAGRPPIKEPLSAAVRRDLVRYIRSRRLDHPIIVGHSMGGFIAYWLASKLPEVVGPVVIVDASPALSGDLEEAKLLRKRWAKAGDEEFARQARFMYRGMVRNPQRLAPIAELAARSDRRTIGDAIYEMMITNLTEQVKDIRSPVLVLVADGFYRRRVVQQASVIPDREIVLMNTKHFVMIDDPPAWFRELDRFLAKHPPRR